MRINVYSQELLQRTQTVRKVSDNGKVHFGIRLYFEGSPKLHRRADDDDESAITFWLPNCGSFDATDLAMVFAVMAQQCNEVAVNDEYKRSRGG